MATRRAAMDPTVRAGVPPDQCARSVASGSPLGVGSDRRHTGRERSRTLGGGVGPSSPHWLGSSTTCSRPGGNRPSDSVGCARTVVCAESVDRLPDCGASTDRPDGDRPRLGMVTTHRRDRATHGDQAALAIGAPESSDRCGRRPPLVFHPSLNFRPAHHRHRGVGSGSLGDPSASRLCPVFAPWCHWPTCASGCSACRHSGRVGVDQRPLGLPRRCPVTGTHNGIDWWRPGSVAIWLRHIPAEQAVSLYLARSPGSSARLADRHPALLFTTVPMRRSRAHGARY